MTLLDIFFRQNFKVEVSAPVIEMLKRDIYESKYFILHCGSGAALRPRERRTAARFLYIIL